MIKLVLPLILASALGGCAVYGPPPAPAPYYQTSTVYTQPAYSQPVYTQPVYVAPQPVYVPAPWFSFNLGYWGGHGWRGHR